MDSDLNLNDYITISDLLMEYINPVDNYNLPLTGSRYKEQHEKLLKRHIGESWYKSKMTNDLKNHITNIILYGIIVDKVKILLYMARLYIHKKDIKHDMNKVILDRKEDSLDSFVSNLKSELKEIPTIYEMKIFDMINSATLTVRDSNKKNNSYIVDKVSDFLDRNVLSLNNIIDLVVTTFESEFSYRETRLRTNYNNVDEIYYDRIVYISNSLKYNIYTILV